VEFVVDKVALEQVFFLYFCFSLPILFHQYSILNFIHVFFLPEGQADETWELSKGKCPFVSLGALGSQVLSLLMFIGTCIILIVE